MEVQVSAEEADDELVEVFTVYGVAVALKNGIVKEAPHEQDAENAGSVFAPGFFDGHGTSGIEENSAADHDEGDAGAGTENAVVKVDDAPLWEIDVVPAEGGDVNADDAEESQDTQDIEIDDAGLGGLGLGLGGRWGRFVGCSLGIHDNNSNSGI